MAVWRATPVPMEDRGLRHYSFLPFEPLPLPTRQAVLDNSHGTLELGIVRIEVWSYPDARARSKIHDDALREEQLGDFVGIRHVERNRSAAPRGVTWCHYAVAARVSQIDQALRLPNALLANPRDPCLSNELRSLGRGEE